jgi:phosphoserine phosphatase
MEKIQLISSDLNGTLVHQHTMMDMIRVGFPHEPQRFEAAKDAFLKQTDGRLSMEKAFQIAGPLTKGLPLRAAIEYALSKMRFLTGFEVFIRTLHQQNIFFVINSTGYGITMEVIKAVYGPQYFYDVICNRLVFENHGKTVEEAELSGWVKNYVQGDRRNSIYDDILAAGTVEFGIRNENEKARLLFEMADRLNIPRTAVVHIGDTMGDSGGICEVARNGGMGIAFNYNEALRTYIEEVLRNERISGKLLMISPKSESSDIRDILRYLTKASGNFP